MKKVIIVEKDNDDVVGIDKNGAFYRLKKKNAVIGDSYEVGFMKRMVIILLAIALLLFCGVGSILIATSINNTPVTYVSIDINPGIEFTLNKYDNVLSVNATNEECKVLISNEDFIGKDIKECTQRIVELAVDAGYISKEVPMIDIVSADSDTTEPINALLLTIINNNLQVVEDMKESLKDTMEKTFIDKGVYSIVVPFCRDNSCNMNQDSESATMGRMMLSEIAEDIDEQGRSVEELQKLPIKKLYHIINEGQKKEYKTYELEKEGLQKQLEEIKALSGGTVFKNFDEAEKVKVARWIEMEETYIKANGIDWNIKKTQWQNNLKKLGIISYRSVKQ